MDERSKTATPLLALDETEFGANGLASSFDEKAWREFLGPLLTRGQAMQRLAIASDAEFDDLIVKRQLLVLPTSEGEQVFLEFQFSERGSVYPEVASVMQAIAEVVTTPYTIASWFEGPKAYFEGESPIRWIELGRDPAPVIAGAQFAAAHLAH